jgi:hypothetical protein
MDSLVGWIAWWACPLPDQFAQGRSTHGPHTDHKITIKLMSQEAKQSGRSRRQPPQVPVTRVRLSDGIRLPPTKKDIRRARAMYLKIVKAAKEAAEAVKETIAATDEALAAIKEARAAIKAQD